MRLIGLIIAFSAIDASAQEAGLPNWALGPFEKVPQPVMSPNPDASFACPVLGKLVRWEAQNVYNPAAIVREGKVNLLYRADDEPRAEGWGRTCRTGLAMSGDGRDFLRLPRPVIYPNNDVFEKFEWEGGCEDIHVVENESGTYYANYTAWDGRNDTLMVATSKDLLRWQKRGPAFAKAYGGRYVPHTRTGAVVTRRDGERLVATKINGKYWMYWMIGCYLATSDDLINWSPVTDAGGRLISALAPRNGRFDSASCEAGAIALLTDAGIVLLYNAENAKPENGGDATLPAGFSSLGQALFDKDDPSKLIARLDKPFLRVEHDWEREGFASNALVSNGLVYFKGEWLLYYGAADRLIGLAVAKQ